jgi:acetyl-CoA/propionyl-CoA carboxylase, biotin carboxylase, biotin carboxyl carrier protein
VRVDSGVGPGSEVTPMYDPMVAKLIVWDRDREHATRRMLRALGEYEIGGLKTLIPFHTALLATEQWARGGTCRDLIEDREWLKALAFPKAEMEAPEGTPEAVEHSYTVEVSGRKFDVRVIGPPFGGANGSVAPAAGSKPRRAERAVAGSSGGADELVSPLQGNMWKIVVEPGQEVAEGQLVCIIEAMKMENEIAAHKAGVIEELAVKEGEPVTSGATIAVIKSRN